MAQALTRSYGSFDELTAFKESNAPVPSVILLNGLIHNVEASAGTGAITLNNGNFANPYQDPQIASNTTAISTVNPVTGSAVLLAGGQLNQIRDSGTSLIPLANSVAVETILVVELNRTYSAQAPSAAVQGDDELEDENGIDPDGIIDWLGAAKLTLTSDGVSKWSL